MESPASIPKGRTASYSNDGLDFIVAMDIDYVSMTRRCYGHYSDGQC
jgi:hypothetical protein